MKKLKVDKWGDIKFPKAKGKALAKAKGRSELKGKTRSQRFKFDKNSGSK
jgi:hypothetical protein